MKRLFMNRQLQGQRGQSMVEMALMMVIILVILSMVLDLGRGFFSFIAIQNAAAEGALFAAIQPNCQTQSDCPDPNNVEYRARHESPAGLVDLNRMDISVTTSAIAEGQPITVTVLYRYQMIGPFSVSVPGGELTFKAHAVQNILDVPQ